MENINKQSGNKKINIANSDSSWLDEELNACNFPDERLHTKFLKLIKSKPFIKY